jgi:3-hydroxybutyryl-CoA dehydrogenase
MTQPIIFAHGDAAHKETLNQMMDTRAKVIWWDDTFNLKTLVDEWQQPDCVIDFAPSAMGDLSKYDFLPDGTVLMLPVLELPLHSWKAPTQRLDNPLTLVGFNNWPGALANSTIEVSARTLADQTRAAEVFAKLGWSVGWVADQVGLVTPRVIAMVINEAYLTLQEGTASREDIDLSMRLGVNYPFGPFEWASRIGLDKVLTLLDSLWSYTHDPRYQASLLMRREVAVLA